MELNDSLYNSTDPRPRMPHAEPIRAVGPTRYDQNLARQMLKGEKANIRLNRPTDSWASVQPRQRPSTTGTFTDPHRFQWDDDKVQRRVRASQQVPNPHRHQRHDAYALMHREASNAAVVPDLPVGHKNMRQYIRDHGLYGIHGNLSCELAKRATVQDHNFLEPVGARVAWAAYAAHEQTHSRDQSLIPL